MAERVLLKYPIKNYQLKFIQHGENATFKVSTAKSNFLLRLHRDSYHSKEAILEELELLNWLSNNSVLEVQKPLSSKFKKYVELGEGERMPSRFCSILHWRDGRSKYKSLSSGHFESVGELTSNLHKSTKGFKLNHRNYWDTQGLIGLESTMGSFRSIESSISKKQYEILSDCRKMVFSKLMNYQKKYPEKMNVVHGDLHFGNLLWSQNKVTPIDFDDCGYGFELMDLAVTLNASSNILKNVGKTEAKRITDSLLNGYSKSMSLSDFDLEILPYFILARDLVLFAWLHGRRTNPKLAIHFKKSVARMIKTFNNSISQGPQNIF
ncbi:MAG: phosphotransferase enzyme family protein [Bdellovibrionales bacterium]